MRLWGLAIALFCMLWATPAAAQDGRWWRAESAHFIIYGDQGERQVRQAAQTLEDLHAVLLAVTGAQAIEAESKLEVFLVRNVMDLRAARPGTSEGVGGFYLSGAEQIAVFVRIDARGGLERNTVLFHEYAHHFMLHYFPAAYPRWYVEGFAEYVGATEFIGRRAHVGRPSAVRSDWLRYGGTFPIEHLLAPERVTRRSPEFSSQFYANAWFAAMYLANTPERMRGLNNYVALLGEGADPIEAFAQGFGITPAEFERELRVARGGRALVTVFDLGQPSAVIDTSRLPRAADDLLLPLVRLRTSAGELGESDAAALQRLAARAPAEPMAQLLLARLAIRQGDSEAARGHVERLLANDENHAEARYLLASLILREAEKQSPQEAYDAVLQARRELVRGFRANPNHYPTLYLYASTFAGGAQPMSDEQLNVLARALELAPQSNTIRLLLVRELMVAGEFETAIVNLQPLLYDPHNPSAARHARAMLDAARRRGPPPVYVPEGDEDGDEE